jgi:glycosyltransferase involved in cell wall biosynthesis
MTKKAVFITTKNLDYLRNVQEIELLKRKYELTVIGSSRKSYLKRLIKVYFDLLTLSVEDMEEVFIGFAPQLIVPFWKRKFKKNYVTIDFFISLYDTMVFDRKKFKEKSWFTKILKKIDEITIKNADHIIVDTKAHGQYFVEEFHAAPEKLEVLYLNADPSIYYPMRIRKPEEYAGKFVVLYFGSVLPLQGVDIILQAVKVLEEREDIYFEIIGPVPEKYQKTKNVTYIPWLEQKDLAGHIAYADLCLAGHFNKNIMKAKRTIPGKAYIYRAMGKSMILGDNPATHELYHEQDEGIYFVPMGDPKALANKIIIIKNGFCVHL